MADKWEKRQITCPFCGTEETYYNLATGGGDCHNCKTWWCSYGDTKLSEIEPGKWKTTRIVN